MRKRTITGIILIISGLWLAGRGIWIWQNGIDFQGFKAFDNIPQMSVSPNITRFHNYLDDNLFRYKDPLEATKAGSLKQDEYSIIVTGDVIPARSVNSVMTRRNNFKYSFGKTADFLKVSDLVFINLETPLIPGCKLTDKGMKFCGSEKAVEGLIFAGVDVVSLANNHAGNYGTSGLEKTKNLLEKNRIQVTGLGKPAIIQVKDKKFGFLGYNDVEKQESLNMSLASEEHIATEVGELKKRSDFTVVLFHWGIEYTSSPSARQKELAHLSIDSGADLVVGNHPHWVQGVEVYKGKFIAYAHGNFIFDQMWSQETREGVIGKYVFDKDGLKTVSFYPVIIENYSQPRFAKVKEGVKILNRMKEASISVY